MSVCGSTATRYSFSCQHACGVQLNLTGTKGFFHEKISEYLDYVPLKEPPNGVRPGCFMTYASYSYNSILRGRMEERSKAIPSSC